MDPIYLYFLLSVIAGTFSSWLIKRAAKRVCGNPIKYLTTYPERTIAMVLTAITAAATAIATNLVGPDTELPQALAVGWVTGGTSDFFINKGQPREDSAAAEQT